ncbi:MAG: RNA polymerase sigma factor [Lentisphaeraceae bacterium]|nr:RNA polymerase sigma factor [Lentisphaeraceae bacterium]
MDTFLKEIEERKDEFYRYVYRNIWDTSVADDVFSSAVLAAYKSKSNFKEGSNFRAWMYRILTNKCFVANREISRRGENIDDYQNYFVDAIKNESYKKATRDPDEFLEMCGDEVLVAMKKLSTMERSCLLLKTMQHFSYKEIAEILEIPFGTVMTHLSRGRAKLRKELTDYAHESGHLKKPEVIAFEQGRKTV